MSQVTNDRFSHPPRSIKPRTRAHKALPVVAIHGSDTLDESGEVGSLDELIRRLPYQHPTLFTALGAAALLTKLNSIYLLRDPASWQWRVSVHERDLIRPDGFKAATHVSTVVHYFGWKHGNYHKLIDPISMYGHKLDKIWPGSVSPVQDENWQKLVKLLKWGITLRDFCSENNIDIRPTMGGISSQFLTDRRFYPRARRKVPTEINQRAREELPGNHYFLNVQPSSHENFTALYLDQHRAHHYHARTTLFPSADHLYAYGRFTDLGECTQDKISPNFHGLYCLDLAPPIGVVPYSHLRELTKVFVFSNELQHLLDVGYKVVGVRAAWGSRMLDEGLNLYARWASEQLDRYHDAPWLKPLLLSAYGTLATRPRISEAIFRLAKAGETVSMTTGKRSLNGRLARATKKLEPGIANVLHRGMIEAATRSESIGLAQWLDYNGQRVLSIYADAVIVEQDDDKPLPVLPEPWRIKRELNHLQFINQQAFTSDGMTKLPGVSREAIPYRQHRTPGHAPRVVQYEALTGNAVQTNRRI